MATSAALPAGEPPGFPKCPKCPYVRAGPARICAACAGRTLEAIGTRSCPVCSQRTDDGPCRNWICTDPQRRVERIDAIAYLSGPLHAKIRSYKYDGKTGWSLIFGRLLVGWLNANPADPPDLIVANPTFPGPGRQSTGHIETILHAAATADIDARWPFDTHSPAVIIKTRATDKSAGRTAAAKRASAAALQSALRVPDAARTTGRDILVFDDVCTTGSQINAVADCLITEGNARRIRGLVLARAPWRPR